jgi:2-polyprenyl-6-methoxyphenol hydroxylase-like FAD-dependent oxidoreductase
MAGKVLVSGAGVAGSCVAWWLHRYGYDVTLVEQASRPRDGGYVIDFWGLGYEVADRMGLLGRLKQSDLAVEEFRTVNARGRKVSGIDQGALQDLAGGRMMSLQRSALARELYEAVEDLATTRFGDSVTALLEGADGVDARFRSGVSEKFDLVVAADGLHSVVRRLTFGEEASFEHFLG